MNSQVNLLLSAVDSFSNGGNPFVNGFIETEKASKSAFLFVLKTFTNAVRIVSESVKTDVSTQANLDLTRACEFLIERVRFKENILIPSSFHFMNPLSNKWDYNERFDYDLQLSFWVLVINELRN